MKQQMFGLFGVSLLMVLAISGAFYLGGSASEEVIYQTPTSANINYKANVCLNQLVSETGERIDLGCDHNVLYNSGANGIRDTLGNINTSAPFQNISFCNATAGCGTPVAAASETFNLISTCGLGSQAGAYAVGGGNGNWTISKTFTSTCNNLETNVTRLTNSSGTNFAGNAFTLATLQNNDQLTLTWTITVS